MFVYKLFRSSYSIILFQTAVNKDIASFGYATTIGPNQFHELTLNRVLNPTVEHKGGRPGKVYLVLTSTNCIHQPLSKGLSGRRTTS